MSLEAGSKIGPYEVIAKLGEGGMGEVFRARDTKLNRDVALKILPESVAGDPDRVARFQREAQTLAALNHPNIAHLHGFEESGGVSALVMELVEGEDLSAVIKRGPVAFADAMAIARQIADALENAHDQGIIHRDLKPGNIKVRPDGTVKVLDFGLAKALSNDPTTSTNAQNSPTLTARATQMGVILGTAAYMAPEQARGRPVDRRADNWAFGVVLYEMLTGARAFDGDDISITLAGVLKDDVKWGTLPADTPPSIRRLLRRCLEKDPKKRLSAIGDARLEIDEADAKETTPSATAQAPALSRVRERAALALAAILAIALAAVAYIWYPRAGAPPSPVSFTVMPPPGERLPTGPGQLALSPDGTKLAFFTGQQPGTKLWLRTLGTLDPVRLEKGDGGWQPAWSPNGQSIVFVDGVGGLAPLKRLDLAGGPVIQLAAESGGRPAWSPAGVILFGGKAGALYRVPEAGGTRTVAIPTDPKVPETLDWPVFLPDGRRFLFVARPSTSQSKPGLYLGTLDSPDRKLILDVVSSLEYAAGYLFYQREGTLMALPFDATAGRPLGQAFPVVEQLNYNSSNGRAAMSVSTSGTVAYVLNTGDSLTGNRVLHFRAGVRDTAPRTFGPAPYQTVGLSPDGRQAVVVQSEQSSIARRLYLLDIERGVSSRFTVGDVDERNAIWSPDGAFIAFQVFQSDRGKVAGIYRRGSGGGATTDEVLWETLERVNPSGFSSDSKRLLFTRGGAGDQRIWILPLDGKRTPVQVFPGSTVSQSAARFSPDDKWIVYHEGSLPSNQQVYMQPYPPDGRRIPISIGPGYFPHFAPGGRRIIYRAPTGDVMAVDLTPEGTSFRPSAAPIKLFTEPTTASTFGFSMDRSGEKFLFASPIEQNKEAPVVPVTVVVNFAQNIKK